MKTDLTIYLYTDIVRNYQTAILNFTAFNFEILQKQHYPLAKVIFDFVYFTTIPIPNIFQDIIDRAIIGEQADKSGYHEQDPLPASYIQEMPYPCHCWDA